MKHIHFFSALIAALLLSSCGAGNNALNNENQGEDVKRTVDQFLKEQGLIKQGGNQLVVMSKGENKLKAKGIFLDINKVVLKGKDSKDEVEFDTPTTIDLLDGGLGSLVSAAQLDLAKVKNFHGVALRAYVDAETAHIIDENGEKQDLKLPSNVLKVKFRGIDDVCLIGPGKNALAIMDYKLHKTGNGKHILRPVVSLDNGDGEATCASGNQPIENDGTVGGGDGSGDGGTGGGDGSGSGSGGDDSGSGGGDDDAEPCVQTPEGCFDPNL